MDDNSAGRLHELTEWAKSNDRITRHVRGHLETAKMHCTGTDN